MTFEYFEVTVRCFAEIKTQSRSFSLSRERPDLERDSKGTLIPVLDQEVVSVAYQLQRLC